MKPNHSPVKHSNKIFLAGRKCLIQWEDDSEGLYLIVFANDYWLRVQEDITGREFVAPRETIWRIHPKEQE